MPLPTEPIGSIPRTQELLKGLKAFGLGKISQNELDNLYEGAVQDTIRRFEETGSPVITDGEQTKPSFVTYPLQGSASLASDGVIITFADGHTRQLPRLTSGPFQYKTYAVKYLENAKKYANVPVKQAVIAASALSLLYPEAGIKNYSREEFLKDLVNETETDIRLCLEKGAHKVQIDFTEGRLSVKLDPSKNILNEFIRLNNLVIDRFTLSERMRIVVHTCPGGDLDSTHSADVDYGELLPSLFQLNAGNFYIQLASEKDRRRVLGIIQQHSKTYQNIFVGVIDPINPELETPKDVRDRVLEAAEYIEPDRLGTTDDCGFSPFGDDTSTARETAFEKIRARVIGTELASKELGL